MLYPKFIVEFSSEMIIKFDLLSAKVMTERLLGDGWFILTHAWCTLVGCQQSIIISRKLCTTVDATLFTRATLC